LKFVYFGTQFDRYLIGIVVILPLPVVGVWQGTGTTNELQSDWRYPLLMTCVNKKL
jgi:hypothetical protein